MNKLRLLYLLLPLWASSCGHSENQATDRFSEDTIPVQLLTLNQHYSSQEIKTSGVFTTDDEMLLSFKNGGVINKIYVKEGDPVKGGQLLASLNPTETDAGFAQAKLNAEKAQRDFERAKALYQDSVATLEQFQNAETALRIAKEQLRTANYNLNQTEIRAVGSGFVLKKLASDGQVVGPGTPVLQLNPTNGKNWQLKVGISDKQWAVVQVGDSATVRADALGELPAVVYKKSEGIDPSSGTFSLLLKIIPGKTDPRIGTGMFAQALIKSRQQTEAWSIPYDAILDGDAGKAFVFITNDQKTAKRVPVEVSAIQQDQVTVTGGLENARALIISGSAYLTDGSPIKVVKF